MASFDKKAAIALLVLGCLSGPAARAQEEAEPEDDPVELGIEEQVEVQLVLVDFLVLDRRGRTVPDMTVDNFKLQVDGRYQEIASLDRDCPLGSAGDPKVGFKGGIPPSPPTAQPRRIALVFDYYHMQNMGDTFDRALEMLDTLPTGEEEHMIASLGEVVRVEAPFTRDLDELRWAIRRMRNDRDLFAGQYDRLTERAFFDRIKVLFDLLERLPGRKTIVLFSGPFGKDGFFHDPEFRELSALSTTARTAVYPVDTGGMRAEVQRTVAFGGPGELRRLANETGGRMTAETNDLGLGYARAHRDLGCTYTLGFYDPGRRFNRNRRLTIKVKKRRGVRVVYPEFYVVRSEEKKRKSMRRTAAMAPHMFESDEMEAELFVVGPRSPDRWRAVVGVELRAASDRVVEAGEEWDLEAFLRKPNGTVIRSFKRRIAMPPTDLERLHNPPVQLFHEISVPPGRYAVSVVLTDPKSQEPLAATRPAALADVPLGRPFLIGPVLGRRGTPDDDGKPNAADPAFLPLLEGRIRVGAPLDALTLLCVAGGSEDAVRTIGRRITTLDGESVRLLDDVAARLGDGRAVQCHEQIDTLSTTDLGPGTYEITASARAGDWEADPATAEFEIESSP